MFLLIEALHLLIALLGILPRRVVFIFEEEGAIAGIFRVDIQLAGDNRPRTTGVVPSWILLIVLRRGFQHLLDHIAQQRAFGINFRADLHRLRRRSGKLIRAASASAPDHVVAIFIPLPSVLALRLQKLKRKA